ncbi:pheromone A receptor-domain-containing protein [Tuber indicum]|nr:pheromone A receptor-domain-containing protein [Tuber indicum]
MTTTNIFISLSGLSIIAALVPLAWHIRNKNTAAICLIVWITISNFLSFSNAIIWGGSGFDIYTAWDGKIFCDIEVKFFIASGAGIVGSVVAIARNLARAMSDKLSVIKTERVRRRELIQDLLLCLGLPVWMMAMHYLVQPSRYLLLATTGCTPTISYSWPSIPLILIWPPIISLVSAYYAGLVLARVHIYRQQFADILRSSNSGLTTSRFIRLFVLSLILVLINLPLTFYVFYRNLDQPRVTYDWNSVHGKGWNYILRIPSYDTVQFDRWISVGAGYVLFFVFGTGSDALRMYRGWLDTIGLGKYLPDSITGTFTLGNNRSGSQSGTGTIESYLPKRWASRRQLGSGNFSNESPSEASNDKRVNYGIPNHNYKYNQKPGRRHRHRSKPESPRMAFDKRTPKLRS